MKDTTKATIFYFVDQVILVSLAAFSFAYGYWFFFAIAFILSALLVVAGVNDNPPYDDMQRVKFGPFWQIQVLNPNVPEDFENEN